LKKRLTQLAARQHQQLETFAADSANLEEREYQAQNVLESRLLNAEQANNTTNNQHVAVAYEFARSNEASRQEQQRAAHERRVTMDQEQLKVFNRRRDTAHAIITKENENLSEYQKARMDIDLAQAKRDAEHDESYQNDIQEVQNYMKQALNDRKEIIDLKTKLQKELNERNNKEQEDIDDHNKSIHELDKFKFIEMSRF